MAGAPPERVVSPSPADLRALADKYRTLAALRARREELEGLGRAGFDEAEGEARRRAFRRVAHAFPGALRELDTCSAALLQKKAEAVEAAAARDTSAIPTWIPVVFHFHHTLREALAIKLWLARRLGRAGTVTDAIVDEYRAAHPAAGTEVDQAFLERHLHPPGGRVLALVWDRLGRSHGLSAAQIREAVFGDPL